MTKKQWLLKEKERYEEKGWNWYNHPQWEILSDIEEGYRDDDGRPLVAFI